MNFTKEDMRAEILLRPFLWGRSICSVSEIRESSNRSHQSLSLWAFRLGCSRAIFYFFENHLMPAVEGKYHTYAKDTTPEGLMASRDHRVFGGFSLGAVTTWLQFCYDYDYIRYFLTMSGSCWYYGTYGDFRFEENVDFIENLVKEQNLNERGYFIYHAVGTEDMVKSQNTDIMPLPVFTEPVMILIRTCMKSSLNR